MSSAVVPARPSWMRLAPSANARSVAVLRIATAIAALLMAVGWVRSDWELLPEALWYPPHGTRWAIDLIPISSGLLQIASLVFLLAVVLVLVGYRARWAAAIATVAGLYVGWIPHLAGKVDHNHHIIWFLALLALSPCDDSLSLRKSGRSRAPEDYALPALAGVLIIGIIYLSSGVPKVVTGLDWAFSDNIRNLMWNMWWEKSHSPPVRVDQWPLVYKTMGLATIAFEVLFLPAALYRRTRVWIRWIGLGFHFFIYVFLAINFWTLAILYVVLFDWDKKSTETGGTGGDNPSVAPLVLVSLIAIGAATIPAGWPLSAYPGFAGIAEPRYVDYELVSADGVVLVTRSVLSERFGPQRARPMAGAALITGREAILLAFASEVAGQEPGYFYEIRPVEISTVPGEADEP